MDYITIYTLRKMRVVGFSYPEYEHFLNHGMLFYYQDDEYLIGGFSKDDFTEQDKEVAQQGEWLPEATQLLKWLQKVDFSVAVSMDEVNYYSVQAMDTINGAIYTGGDYTLANALAKVIIKVCKSNRREYTPKTTLRLRAIEENN